MDKPRIFDLEQQSWQPHPTITGILTKIFENQATHPYADAFLGKVVVGGAIPWHVHEAAAETAYVLQGVGTFLFAETAGHETPTGNPIRPGVAFTIPVGWWHSVVNNGDEPLLFFGFHTPPTF